MIKTPFDILTTLSAACTNRTTGRQGHESFLSSDTFFDSCELGGGGRGHGHLHLPRCSGGISGGMVYYIDFNALGTGQLEGLVTNGKSCVFDSVCDLRFGLVCGIEFLFMRPFSLFALPVSEYLLTRKLGTGCCEGEVMGLLYPELAWAFPGYHGRRYLRVLGTSGLPSHALISACHSPSPRFVC